MNETVREPEAPEPEETAAAAAAPEPENAKKGGLPRLKMPAVVMDRRLRIAAAVSAGVLAVLILAGMAALKLYRGITEPLPDSGLLARSIKAQQQDLMDRKQELDREQEALRKEREEYTRYLNELHQVEDKLEDLMLTRQEGEDRQAARDKAEAVRLRREEEEERRRLAEKARQDSLTQMTNIRKMSKIYNGMRPAALAVILPELKEDLALQILLRMEERRIGRLFAVLEPKYAARLSQKLNEAKKEE